MNAASNVVVADDGRDETPAERYDRNWSEVLQELRVMQTGTQIITGFLLALAFQPAFADLSDPQKSFYLFLVALGATSAVLALAPVAVHRLLFRQRLKRVVVTYGHVGLIAALATVSALLVGVVIFVFDVVVSLSAAIWVGSILGAVTVGMWIVVPLAIRARAHAAEQTTDAPGERLARGEKP